MKINHEFKAQYDIEGLHIECSVKFGVTDWVITKG